MLVLGPLLLCKSEVVVDLSLNLCKLVGLERAAELVVVSQKKELSFEFNQATEVKLAFY